MFVVVGQRFFPVSKEFMGISVISDKNVCFVFVFQSCICHEYGEKCWLSQQISERPYAALFIHVFCNWHI